VAVPQQPARWTRRANPRRQRARSRRAAQRARSSRTASATATLWING